MNVRRHGRRLELVRPPLPELDLRSARAPSIVVLIGEIPAIAIEARIGVLPAVVKTCLGTVPAADAPRTAVEIHYASRSLPRDDLIAAAGGGARVAPTAGFVPDPSRLQKPHLARDDDFHRHFSALYPAPRGYAASTAAARVNGYLAGYGTVDGLSAELSQLGLPAPLERALRVRVFPGTVCLDQGA